MLVKFAVAVFVGFLIGCMVMAVLSLIGLIIASIKYPNVSRRGKNLWYHPVPDEEDDYWKKEKLSDTFFKYSCYVGPAACAAFIIYYMAV